MKRARSASLSQYGMMDVDVESIVRSQSLVHENAGMCWSDGHILGNGDVGVVGYLPHWMEWTINKVDIFDNRNAPKKRLTHKEVMEEVRKRGAKDLRFLDQLEKPDLSNSPLQALLKSAGQVKVRTRHNEFSWGGTLPPRTRQELSLWDATDRMEMIAPAGHPLMSKNYAGPRRMQTRSFVCRDRNVTVIRLRGATNAYLMEKRLELCRPYDADYEPAQFGTDGKRVWFTQRIPDGTSYAMMMEAVPLDSPACRSRKVKPAVDGVEQKGDRIWLKVTGDFDLFVTVATSYENPSPLTLAGKLMDGALKAGADRLEREHARWWAEFWRKSFIQIDGKQMFEQLWYMGLYEAGCSFGRAPVPGLFGLWYGYHDMPQQGFFWAVYTLDQNIQLHTLPVFCVNHPELAAPFMDTFINSLPKTISETREKFDLPGACFGLEMTFTGGEPSFSSAYRYCLCGGPFVGAVYVWAWRYTRDRRLLRGKIYPFLREVVRFFTAFMQKGDDGLYHLPPTVPAEIFTLSRDAVDTLGLLKPCLKLAIEASEMFQLDAAEREKWKDVLTHYPPYPVKKGIIVDGADIPLKHPSHMTYRILSLVLGHECDPQHMKLVERTLKHITPRFRSRDGRVWKTAGWPWFFFTRAKLMYGDCREMFPLLGAELRTQLKPNGLFIHMTADTDVSMHPRARELGSPTPENNGAVMMILTEMLMQSFDGIIRLFPGMAGRQSARFGGLRAEGGFLVSSELSAGKVKFVGVTAENAGTARVVNPWSGKAVRLVRKGGGTERLTGAEFTVSMRQGETVMLLPGDGKVARCKVSSARPAGPKEMKFGDGAVIRLGSFDRG